MKVYNPGTLIVLKSDSYKYRGVILSIHEDDSWWGGGYYSFLWTPQTETGHTDNISFNQVIDWDKTSQAKIYPIE